MKYLDRGTSGLCSEVPCTLYCLPMLLRLIGMVRVKLEDADFFGETVHKRIEERSLEASLVTNYL